LWISNGIALLLVMLLNEEEEDVVNGCLVNELIIRPAVITF
jgi:hypothetical protein